jgi:hypothetical protein
MPKISRGEVVNEPMTKRQHKAVQADEKIVTAVEGTGRLADATDGGRK